jgi:hypothetical protein
MRIMRALIGDLLLTAWERCAGEHDLERAVTMLALALPASSREQLVELPLGERNMLLLRLHEISFGRHLRGFAACSQYGEALEFALLADSLAKHLEARLGPTVVENDTSQPLIEMRPVNTRDLLATLAEANPAQAQDRLLALGAGAALRAQPSVLQTFERINAAAELTCTIACPACASAETLDLDLARFLWLEVRHAARRLMEEVDALAGAYGWSERTIVRMSPRRRGAYLGMLDA